MGPADCVLQAAGQEAGGTGAGAGKTQGGNGTDTPHGIWPPSLLIPLPPAPRGPLYWPPLPPPVPQLGYMTFKTLSQLFCNVACHIHRCVHPSCCTQPPSQFTPAHRSQVLRGAVPVKLLLLRSHLLTQCCGAVQSCPSDAKLWCALGDITQQDEHYVKAWEVSGNRSSRAQRSLGRYVQNFTLKSVTSLMPAPFHYAKAVHR